MVSHDTQCTTMKVEMKYQKILALYQKLRFIKHQPWTEQKSPLYFRVILCCSHQQPHFKGEKTKFQRNTQLIIFKERSKYSNLQVTIAHIFPEVILNYSRREKKIIQGSLLGKERSGTTGPSGCALPNPQSLLNNN